MIVAWISDEEIIPFENIECVCFDEVNDTKVAEVLLTNTKETVRIAGDNVTAFKTEYVAWIKLVSMATGILEDLQQ